MPRPTPTARQNFLSSVILPLLSIPLIPVSLLAVVACLVHARARRCHRRFLLGIGGVAGGKVKGLSAGSGGKGGVRGQESELKKEAGKGSGKGCVIISGGRMSKGLTLARAFKRAGWKVIGVEERGWGELCPLRFSSAISAFHLLPPAATSYSAYSAALQHIAQQHHADLFIPVSGAGSSVEDSLAADEMYAITGGRCRTFIQDPETMRDLHDKDRFMGLVERLGMKIPQGRMVRSVSEAMEFLLEGDEGGGGIRKPRYVLKCMGLDENRGDMTLFPLRGDTAALDRTRERLEALKLGISQDCPYVFQEFIKGQEWCTHASVVRGRLTSFVAAPSNDMLMTYENGTSSPIGQLAEDWTRTFLAKLRADHLPSDVNATTSPPQINRRGGTTAPEHSELNNGDAGARRRGLTGHFSFDFIVAEGQGGEPELYPIECNARVHTAVILLPLDRIAACYEDHHDTESVSDSTQADGDKEDELGEEDEAERPVLRPLLDTRPRSWLYNDLIMRYLPLFVPLDTLRRLHPSLPACHPSQFPDPPPSPSESPWRIRLDPTLIAVDWIPFLVLWHVYWPALLISRWWQGKKWTRLNVSTGRIFEA